MHVPSSSQVPELAACAGTFAKAEAAAGKVQQGPGCGDGDYIGHQWTS